MTYVAFYYNVMIFHFYTNWITRNRHSGEKKYSAYNTTAAFGRYGDVAVRYLFDNGSWDILCRLQTGFTTW